MNYRWQGLPAPAAETVAKLQESLGIDPYLARLLAQRNVADYAAAKAFFRPDLKALHSPWLMQDMRSAVARIDRARQQGEKIMIYGDYDVDGTTAVALMLSFLRQHYPPNLLRPYIPDRYREGYGISQAGIDNAAQAGESLIIALDCGIQSVDLVAYAREQGIDFIICDHHLPGAQLPAAVAVLDPQRADCAYPFKGLSGCGVGFKLVQALSEHWQIPADSWRELLDLLAVSIGADIVPIVGENRILAYYGLQRLNQQPRPGLEQLISIAGPKDEGYSITDVVFRLAPRINAAGRLAHGIKAVELLTGEDLSSLELVAEEINDNNLARRELDRDISQAALQQLEAAGEQERYSTVVYAPGWHKGVVGIVASRLIENYYRPTVVLTRSGNKLAGSARSVEGFDLYRALEACREELIQFGGHRAAAGMTLKQENYAAFKAKFEAVVRDQITPEQREPRLLIDLDLAFAAITPKFFRILQQMAPFGPQNMIPTFASHGLRDAGSRLVGQDQSHLKVVLQDPKSGAILSGIGFGMSQHLPLLQSGVPISVAYHLEQNEFRGQVSLQLRLKDLKESAVAQAEMASAKESAASPR